MPHRPHHPHPIRRFFTEPRTCTADPWMFGASLCVGLAWFFLTFQIDMMLGRLATICFGTAFICEGSADILPQRRGPLAIALRCIGGSLLLIACVLSLGAAARIG